MRMMGKEGWGRRWRSIAGVLLVSAAGGGCGENGSPSQPLDALDDVGAIHAVVRVSTFDATSLITKVHIDVQPAGASLDLVYDEQTQQYSGTLSVRTGLQTVTATAYVDDLPIGTGSVDVTIARHGSASVNINILDNSSPVTDQDHGPIIKAITATTVSPMAGDSITLSVSAVDPDGDQLSYQWTQTCSGTFGTPTAATSTWSDSTVHSCVITATVRARGLSDTATVSVSVQQAAGALSVFARYIPAPYISSTAVSGSNISCAIARDATDASCRPALAGGAAVTAVVTFDPMPADSGATVTLTDSCGAGGASPSALDLEGGTATFLWTAPLGPASCILSATVQRETLVDSQKIAIAVR